MPNIIIVVGLYKSGTSLITKIISEMGYSVLGDLHKRELNGRSSKYLTNESLRVNELNEHILKRFYFSSYRATPNKIIFSLANKLAFLFNFYQKEISELLIPEEKTRLVVKDPRFCITLPWWLSALSKKANVKIIWVKREVRMTSESWLADQWSRDNLGVSSMTEAMTAVRCFDSFFQLQFDHFSNKYPSYIFNLEKIRETPEVVIGDVARFLSYDLNEQEQSVLINSVVCK